MTDAIPISWLNDYLFDPKSIYFHNIVADFDTSSYHQKPQIDGNAAHTTIEDNTYSDSKRYIVAKPVFSDEFNLIGKIDILDTTTHTLIERKKKINQVYQGHIYQLWAQYFALLEEGYQIDSLKIHSISDNQNYSVALPTDQDKKCFGDFVIKLKGDIVLHGSDNINKNITSIYNEYYF